MQWTPLDDAILKRLWAEGQSATEIGMKIGKTKNAVLGRKHRMSLPVHNSKCTAGPAWTPEEIETFTRLWNEGLSRIYIAGQLNRTLPALCNMRTRLGLQPRSTGGQPGPRRPSTRRVRHPQPIAPVTTTAPPAATEHKPCQYPVSGEGRRTVFCSADVKVGSSFCPEHHHRCRVTPAAPGTRTAIADGPLCKRKLQAA